eukprot:3258390-Lingulodinium_polyedra.AAC.1
MAALCSHLPRPRRASALSMSTTSTAPPATSGAVLLPTTFSNDVAAAPRAAKNYGALRNSKPNGSERR